MQSEEERRRLLICLPDACTTILSLPVFDMFAGERIPKDEARKQLGLPVGVPVLLFFGIVRAYKGLADLLTVLPQVRTCLGEVLLLVVGEFWEDKAPYLAMIEALHIADSVIIEDRYVPNEDVPRYFSAADLLIAPYRDVTGSAVVQMGIGFRCPIVTTCVGSLAELAENSPSITLVEPHDGEGLANAIVQHFQRPSESSVDTAFEADSRHGEWDDLAETLEGVLAGCG